MPDDHNHSLEDEPQGIESLEIIGGPKKPEGLAPKEPASEPEAPEAPDPADPAEQEAYAQLKRMRADRRRHRLVAAGIAAGLAAVAIMGFLIWQSLQATAGDTERMVATEPAWRGTFTQEVRASGSIQPASLTAVAPQVEGVIETVSVVAGQHVEAGDTLFTIKNDELDRAVSDADRSVRTARQALDQAAAARDTAYTVTITTNLETGEETTEGPDPEAVASADQAYASAQMELEAASDAYARAVEQASLRRVTAPASGDIIELSATPGASVAQALQASGSLCKVADLAQMKVTVQVGEVDIDKVAVGQTASLSFSALEDVELEASVVSVASVSTGDATAGMSGGSTSYAVELLIPQPDARLKPGMTAEVRIVTRQIENALVVPALALNDTGDGEAIVYVELDPQSHLMSEAVVRIEARGTSEAAVSVVSGNLDDGDPVVIADSTAQGEGAPEDDLTAYAEG